MTNTEIIAEAGSEIIASDEKQFTLNAIKAGTVAHTRDGKPFTFCAHLLEKIAPSWVGGFVKYNHMLPGQGKIVASEWADPFVKMTITGLGDEVNNHLIAERHTGFSIDAVGDLNNPSTVRGTGVSILFDTHKPACANAVGCGLTGTIMADEQIETIVEDVVVEAEEVVEVEAEDLTSKLAETEALLAEKDAAIEGMYTKEQMDEMVAESIEASSAQTAKITAAKDAVKGMFPSGMDATLEAEISEAIEAEDYHAAIVKLGGIDFTPLQASVPTEAPAEEEVVEASESESALDAALNKLNSKFIGA